MSGLSKTTPIASSGIKRMLVGTGALSLVFAGMVTIGETPEASATTCGYHTEHIDREHNWGGCDYSCSGCNCSFSWWQS